MGQGAIIFIGGSRLAWVQGLTKRNENRVIRSTFHVTHGTNKLRSTTCGLKSLTSLFWCEHETCTVEGGSLAERNRFTFTSMGLELKFESWWALLLCLMVPGHLIVLCRVRNMKSCRLPSSTLPSSYKTPKCKKKWVFIVQRKVFINFDGRMIVLHFVYKLTFVLV